MYATRSGSAASPATALHWRIDSTDSRQCAGVIDSAWSVKAKKSSDEQ